MLQTNHIDDSNKPEWNFNETHIIIPAIDGDVISKESDKILTNTLTLGSLESGDQTTLATALEHSFVLGLDKNLFETPSYKSDLVLIQNSDLKLPSGQTDLKNSVAYTISYVDQEKSGILWRSSVSKDRICACNKAILEVRDVLNYDVPVHELEKTEEQINLNIDIASQVAKTNSDVLLDKTINGEKNEKKPQYFNYFAASQNIEGVPILEQLVVTKSNENLKLEEKKFFNFKSLLNSNVQDTYRLEGNPQGNVFNITKSLIDHNELHPVEVLEYEIDKKQETISNKNKGNKLENAEGDKIIEKGSNSLLEKSLPLKKKAKMKRTLTSFNSENQKSLLKQDMITANQQVDIKFSIGKKIKLALTATNFLKDQTACQSYSDESLINNVSKQKKATKLKTTKKFKKNISDSLAQESKNESHSLDNKTLEKNESTKTEISGFHKSKFSTINDLIDCLRKCRMINATVWQTLNSGLKEMKMDILKEINAKKCEKSFPESANYSPQLKAFALVLYFKQPAAFNYLSQVYKNGWPSLNVIKKWKRRMNSYRRPNFVRIEKSIENC